MPELPEVETIVRYLRPQIVGTVVEDLIIKNKGETHFNRSVEDSRSSLIQRKIAGLERHGKWMLFDIEDSPVVAHLRMSGRYEVNPKISDHPHTRFSIKLDSGMFLTYIDQRRFGTFHFTPTIGEYLEARKLGPDALSAKFNPQTLYSALQSTARPIYSALLDQRLVAGLGNIYVNEALHAAAIHPKQPANTISKVKTKVLYENIIRLLTLALEMKGTTLIDNLYQDPEGNTGEFYKLLQVYGKKKDPNIEVMKIAGRSVFVNTKTKLKA